jgi:GH15 family glucan-1,4-alpha-glucosidase
MNQQLFRKSIDVILENQSQWGSYIASPEFPNYHYCWLRDGSFIAHAMDCVGQHASAESFFRWVDLVIRRYAAKVDELERSLKEGTDAGKDAILHTRFTMDGFEGTVDATWGNFQIDGYGTWLWALAEHVRGTGNYALLDELSSSIKVTLRYLALTWKMPNYDCWEEHPAYLHPYSLACVYGGLNEMALLQKEGKIHGVEMDLAVLAAEVQKFILDFGVVNGRFVKHIWPPRGDEPAKPMAKSAVDSSLLGMAYPFKVLDPHDPLMTATTKEIMEKLYRPEGGVYRYRADVYYGGGEWILLTAWLAIHNLRLGKRDLAILMMTWIEDQADARGYLPEQVNDHVLAPAQFEPWLQKWGPVAKPLLWSHAMYLILYQSLKE